MDLLAGTINSTLATFDSDLHWRQFRESTLGRVLNFILVILILVSYIPQYLNIKNRGRDGISPASTILHSVYGASAFANILVHPSAWRLQMNCRDDHTIAKCITESMDYWQFAADWIGSTTILIIYIYTTASLSAPAPTLASQNPEEQQLEDQQDEQELEDESQVHEQPEQLEPNQESPRQHSLAFRLSVGLAIFFEIIILIPPLFFAITPRILSPGWSITIQIISFWTVGITAFFALIYNLPQIWYTWKLGRVGNLSLLTMAIHTPTYFLVAISLAYQYQLFEGYPVFSLWLGVWNPWTNLLFKGCQEAFMLALCIHLYEISVTSIIKRDSVEPRAQVVDEQTPLLSETQGQNDGM